MMLPPPARRISGTAYLHIRKAPVRLTAIALFHCIERQRLDRAVRRDRRRDIDQRREPAECRDGARDRVLCARHIRHIDRERLRTAAAVGDSARHGFRFGRIDIGDGDLGPLRREPSRDRTADLAAAAGDQRHASRQPARLAISWSPAVRNCRRRSPTLGGYGFLMMPMSASPSAIFS